MENRRGGSWKRRRTKGEGEKVHPTRWQARSRAIAGHCSRFSPPVFTRSSFSFSLPPPPAPFFRFSFSFRLQFLARALVTRPAGWFLRRASRHPPFHPPFFLFFLFRPLFGSTRFQRWMNSNARTHAQRASSCSYMYESSTRFLRYVRDRWNNEPIDWRSEMDRENLENSELKLALFAWRDPRAMIVRGIVFLTRWVLFVLCLRRLKAKREFAVRLHSVSEVGKFCRNCYKKCIILLRRNISRNVTKKVTIVVHVTMGAKENHIFA